MRREWNERRKYGMIVPKGCLWQKKKLFESATEIFTLKTTNLKQTSAEQKKIEKLQSKLKDRDEAISYLLRENIEIKKSIDGENQMLNGLNLISVITLCTLPK